MSAAERLRALDAVTSTWPNGFSISRMEATGRVLAALPAIIAVVEAAEAGVKIEATSSYKSIYSAPTEIASPIRAALATLSQALDGEGT